MKNSTYGYIAISISMIFWGASFVWTKMLLNANFPVFTIVFFRLLIASIVFVTIFKIQGKLQKVKKEDRKLFLLLALFEPFLYFVGEDFGLKYSSASFAAVIIALIPIVVAITMHFVDGEKLRINLLFGAIVSIIGICIMTFSGDGQLEFTVKGLLLLCLALLSACGYSVLLSRLLARNYSPISITTYQNFISIFFYLPFVLIFDLKYWPAIQLTAESVFALCCLAILCSAGAYMLYSYAAKQIGITKLSVFTNAIPIVTILFAAALGQETFTAQKFLGIVIVVLGVIWSQTSSRREAQLAKKN
ncbi:MAG: DMT family transporter [Bacteroidales bacterium]|nr:DMT family transporter [Bacteroidales bacterium]